MVLIFTAILSFERLLTVITYDAGDVTETSWIESLPIVGGPFSFAGDTVRLGSLLLEFARRWMLVPILFVAMVVVPACGTCLALALCVWWSRSKYAPSDGAERASVDSVGYRVGYQPFEGRGHRLEKSC